MRIRLIRTAAIRFMREAMREKIGQMEISYSDGSREFFYTLDKKELLEALREDFRSYGSDLIAGALPVGC